MSKGNANNNAIINDKMVQAGMLDLTFPVSASTAMLLKVINGISEYQIPLARRHSENVAAYCLKLTKIEELEFDEGNAQLLWYAALLHDIGKLCLPPEVWNYPRALTTAEFDLVKTHSTIGYEILNTLEISDEVKLGVLHHHERWDGSGYPNGLLGSEIPLFAQMIGVSDVFEALTHRRTYRDAFSEDEAKQIMREKPLKFNPIFIENLGLLEEDPDLLVKIIPV